MNKIIIELDESGIIGVSAIDTNVEIVIVDFREGGPDEYDDMECQISTRRPHQLPGGSNEQG